MTQLLTANISHMEARLQTLENQIRVHSERFQTVKTILQAAPTPQPLSNISSLRLEVIKLKVTQLENKWGGTPLPQGPTSLAGS
jgi:hypothetical protein